MFGRGKERSGVDESGEKHSKITFYNADIVDQNFIDDGYDLRGGHTREYRGKHRSQTRGWPLLKKYPESPSKMKT